MKPYPIFLSNLNERRCVVVGGDHEAERKVNGLLDVDASIVVIAESATDGLKALAAEGRIEWIDREYQPGDLEGAFLVIVSERNPARTDPIYQEARRVGAIMNAMDDVPHCDFVAGSVIRRGPLVISISTSGAAPAVAVRLRQDLERRLGPEFGDYLQILGGLRDAMLEHHPDFDERRRIWYRLADSDLIDLVREGRSAEVRQRIEEIAGIHVAVEATEEEALA